MSNTSSPTPGMSIAISLAARYEATLVMRTLSTKRSFCSYCATTRPAGASRLSTPGVAGGAVAAHRQAATHLDEQDADVAIGAGRRIEHRARHHVMAARLEHQRLADPVVVLEEIEPLLAHGGAPEQRRAAAHQPHRIAASVAVKARKSVDRHFACLRHRHEALNLPRGLQADDLLLLGEESALKRELLAIPAMRLERI